MAQRSPPHRGRALIVEDELLFALNLEAEMHTLGFDVCDLAANGHQASMLAMSNQPDVVLMDINLEGGREGIEVARWLRTVCEAPVVFIIHGPRHRRAHPRTSAGRTCAAHPLGGSTGLPWRMTLRCRIVLDGSSYGPEPFLASVMTSASP